MSCSKTEFCAALQVTDLGSNIPERKEVPAGVNWYGVCFVMLSLLGFTLSPWLVRMLSEFERWFLTLVLAIAAAIAGLAWLRSRTLQRAAERRALAEVLARQEEQRRELADKAVREQAAETLARELNTIFARKPYLALDHVQVQQFLRGRKN
jgi:hypothetical protein